VLCRLTDLSSGGCYLTTNSPFPRGTRVILSIKTGDLEVRAGGAVLVAHPEFGMGIQFLRATSQQRDQAQRMTAALRADKSHEVQVEPDGLETSLPGDGVEMFQSSEGEGSASEHSAAEIAPTDDALVDLFRNQFQVPVETFMQQIKKQRHSVAAHSR
jgi:hypothetical protein